MSLNNWLNFGCRLFAWVVMIWENSSDITPEVAKWSTKFQQNRPLCNWCPMTWVFIEYTFFLLFLSKLRTKRCVTTPLLPFKKWWSTTGRFWDAKYLSTKIIYFHAFFKKFFMISMYRFTICQNGCSDYSSYFSQLNSLHI